MNKPRVAVLMLSWLRFEILLDSLKQISKSSTSPLHLCLRVQGCERLDEHDMARVYDAAKLFASKDIYFTRDNVGTACARLDLLHRAATRTNCEYLMFTDDDIFFSEGGIDQQIEVLDKYPEIGSVSLRPKGIKKVQVVSDNGVLLATYNNVDSSLCEVYLIGSASLMFRTKLYTHYLIAPDPEYYIGTWDWDFILQIRRLGYKVTVITDMVITNRRGGSGEYRKKRRNKKYAVENRRLFRRKWGFDPIKSRRINKDFVGPVLINDELDISLTRISDELPNILPDTKLNDFGHLDYRSGSIFDAPLEPVSRARVIKRTDWRARILRGRQYVTRPTNI